jgi:hypothetical protein
MEREQHDDLMPTVDERAELETGHGLQIAEEAAGDPDSEAEDENKLD